MNKDSGCARNNASSRESVMEMVLGNKYSRRGRPWYSKVREHK